MLDVGLFQVEATIYDESLNETFSFCEYFNYESEKSSAVREVVQRAARKAEELKRRDA